MSALWLNWQVGIEDKVCDPRNNCKDTHIHAEFCTGSLKPTTQTYWESERGGSKVTAQRN